MNAVILKERIKNLEYMIDYMSNHAPRNIFTRWMICVVGIFDDVSKNNRLAYIAEHDDEYRTVSSSFDCTIRNF